MTRAKQQAEYRARYPHKNRESHLRRTYGISLEDYDGLLRKQDRCCAICRRPSDFFSVNLSIDHDHATGEIRGLLCPYCNQRIVGRHRKDKGLDLLQNAVVYLSGPYTGWFVPEKKKRGRSKKKRMAKTKPRKT